MRRYTLVFGLLLGCQGSPGPGDECSIPGQVCGSGCCAGLVCTTAGVCAGPCEFGHECESGCCTSGVGARRVCAPVSYCTTSALFVCEAIGAGYCDYDDTCFGGDFIDCITSFVAGCCDGLSTTQCAYPTATTENQLEACIAAQQGRVCGTASLPPACMGIVSPPP